MRFRIARLALASTAALAACGDDAPSYPGPAQALLGGGIYEFLHEPSCSRVPIIHGVQGGYHVWGSVRARYIDFTNAQVRFTLSDAATGARINEVAGTTDFFPLAASKLTLMTGGDGGHPAGCPDGGVPLDLDGGTPSSAVPDGTTGWGESLALTMYLPQQWNGCMVHACVDGRPLRVRAEVTDRWGRTASDERVLLPRLDPDELSIYCTGEADAGIIAVDLFGFDCFAH